jgi:hypothetical protein
MNKPKFQAHGRPRKRTAQPDIKKPETWYTRIEVARMLGTRVGAVRGLDGVRLHPVLVDGFYRYPPAEVALLQARRKPKGDDISTPPVSLGDIAAVAFGMLNDGACRQDLVMQLRIPPAQAQELYEEWRLDFHTATVLRQQQTVAAKFEKAATDERTERERKRTERLERLRLMFNPNTR